MSTDETESLPPANALGAMLQQVVGERGADVFSLAERAGIPTNDLNALTHEDLGQILAYIQANHPELLQAIIERFPMLSFLLPGGGGQSGGGGILGGLLGRVLGGD